MRGRRRWHGFDGWSWNEAGQRTRCGGGLSDTDGQRVHRQEDQCQDEHAADRGPDPGFHGRVHAGATGAKQCGVCCISFQGHEVRLITLSDLWERYARTMASAAVIAITKRAITLELNCQARMLKSYRRSKRDGG